MSKIDVFFDLVVCPGYLDYSPCVMVEVTDAPGKLIAQISFPQFPEWILNNVEYYNYPSYGESIELGSTETEA